MALDYELAEQRPGTLPADFGDWDSGAPPDTLPPDFEGFDDSSCGHQGEVSPLMSAGLLTSGALEMMAKGNAASAGSQAESSSELSADGEEVDADSDSTLENDGTAKRMTIIALGLILVLAAGAALYFSHRSSSHKTIASPAHSPSEVYAHAAGAPLPVKVASVDSSDELTLKDASGIPADTEVQFTSAGSESESIKTSPNRTQSQPEAPIAKRHGKTE